MSQPNVLFDLEDGVATITLNRPSAWNTFTFDLHAELMSAFDRADADDSVRAVVVTGNGAAFSAGADLSGGEQTFDASARGEGDGDRRDMGGLLTLRIFAMTKPVVAAVNGVAAGLGATILLPMDVRLAGESARFAFVFTRRGIVPEACSTWFLPRVVGISRAAEWCYSGRIVTVDEAKDAGLVRDVLPDGTLLETAQNLARDMVGLSSPVAVALTRQMLWRMLGADHPMEAHRVDSRLIAWLGKQPDAAEGIRSFLDKRSPHFAMAPSSDMPPLYPWWRDPEFDPLPAGDLTTETPLN